MKAAPPARSHRAALRDGNEPSIPPVASDLDDQGQRIFKVGPTPSVVPAPLPTRVAPRLDEDAVERAAVSLVRPPTSPYLRAAAGLALVVCVVLAGRGFARRLRPPQASPIVAAAAPPPPAVDPIPPPPVEEPITPAPTSESAESLKAASLSLLQEGKLDEAVAAGERATSLDPTDADAWRILGAAYEDQGNFASARRSFSACTKSATRGDIRECTLLLR